MKKINTYIIEKLKISKDINIKSQIISDFCKYSTLNYNHENNEKFFNEFIKALKDNNIDLDSELDPIGNENNIFYANDEDKKDFSTNKRLYDDISKILINPSWEYKIDTEEDYLLVGIYKTEKYGWIIKFEVFDIKPEPFYFIVVNEEN